MDPTGYCSTDDSVKDCAGSVEAGQVKAITDADGNTVGFVGKDSDGNVHFTNNGSTVGEQAVGGLVAQGANANVTVDEVNSPETTAMSLSSGQLSREERSELRACRTQTHNFSCSGGAISSDDVEERRGNPAGVGKQDTQMPWMSAGSDGNITFNEDGSINIRIRYNVIGDRDRVEEGIRSIRTVWAQGGVYIAMEEVESADDAHITIQGASYLEMMELGLSCECEALIHVGGWGPYDSPLLMLSNNRRFSSAIDDAHEFGHKLGLRHSSDGGIMDYFDPNQQRRDRRRVIENDRARLRRLHDQN